jgi:gamma-glutamyltranspeptidase/glutathione hydrolase
MKWMASGRSRLGDPFDTINNNELITSEEWVEMVQSNIHDNYTLNHWKDYKPAYEPNEPHGTTHFSVVDDQHNAVSMTSTVNLLFGCLVHDVETDIVLNNEMDDFSIPGRSNAFGVSPSVHNFIKPGKRPLSSTVPTIVVNELGKPDLVIGAAGGSRITTAVFQAIVRIYSYGFPLLETLSYPRLHHQLLPNVIEHEIMVGHDILGSLQEKGHETLEQAPKTAMNAIRRWQGEWHAVSDYWRKRGEAAVL